MNIPAKLNDLSCGGIYLHVPYCKSKCAYCAFYSGTQMPSDEYVHAVLDEYRLRQSELVAPVRTIYFGGGTPSLLNGDQLHQLAENLCRGHVISEFTIECNPDDVTADKAEIWLNAGINRVSMGVQSFSDVCLKRIGRRHDSATAEKAYKILRAAGFSNISLDLIIGLPGETIESWTESVDRITTMCPEHISAYILSFEEGTPLYRQLEAGIVSETPDDLIEQMYNVLTEKLRAAGYRHYEISNYALPGYQSQHNSGYWKFRPYLGLGPAAHSYDGIIRRYNPDDTEYYIHNLTEGHTVYETEIETVENIINDYIMVRLRTTEGLHINSLPQPYRNNVLDNAATLDSTMINFDGCVLSIKPEHFLKADSVMRQMMIVQLPSKV